MNGICYMNVGFVEPLIKLLLIFMLWASTTLYSLYLFDSGGRFKKCLRGFRSIVPFMSHGWADAFAALALLSVINAPIVNIVAAYCIKPEYRIISITRHEP